MKTTIASLSMLIFFFGFIPEVFCADVAKIGIFNFQKILQESSAGKMIQKEVTAKGNELQKKLKAEKDQLDELKKAFEREALVLSPEKQNEKQREFRIRVNDFKKMQENFAKDFFLPTTLNHAVKVQNIVLKVFAILASLVLDTVTFVSTLDINLTMLDQILLSFFKWWWT